MLMALLPSQPDPKYSCLIPIMQFQYYHKPFHQEFDIKSHPPTNNINMITQLIFKNRGLIMRLDIKIKIIIMIAIMKNLGDECV